MFIHNGGEDNNSHDPTLPHNKLSFIIVLIKRLLVAKVIYWTFKGPFHGKHVSVITLSHDNV